MCWQVCCASDPSVTCTGVARGLAVKVVWHDSVVCICTSKTAPRASWLLGLLLSSDHMRSSFLDWCQNIVSIFFFLCSHCWLNYKKIKENQVFLHIHVHSLEQSCNMLTCYHKICIIIRVFDFIYAIKYLNKLILLWLMKRAYGSTSIKVPLSFVIFNINHFPIFNHFVYSTMLQSRVTSLWRLSFWPTHMGLSHVQILSNEMTQLWTETWTGDYITQYLAKSWMNMSWVLSHNNRLTQLCHSFIISHL